MPAEGNAGAPAATGGGATPQTSPSQSMAADRDAWRQRRRAWRDERRDIRHERGDGRDPLLFGLILILVGAYFLARAYVPTLDADRAWPVIPVVIGAVLLLGAVRRTPGPSV